MASYGTAVHSAEHIHQNVETIACLRARAEEDVSAHQRGIEHITAALGHPRSIYVAVAAVAGWLAFNAGAPRLGIRAVDPPPCTYLQGFVGLAALLMTIMVLTTQNRLSKHAEQRAHLDLQVNLLAEQKVAKLIALVEELRRDMPSVPHRLDLVAEVMTEPLDPRAVMNALEQTFVASPGGEHAAQPPQNGEAPKSSAGVHGTSTPAASIRPRSARGTS